MTHPPPNTPSRRATPLLSSCTGGLFGLGSQLTAQINMEKELGQSPRDGREASQLSEKNDADDDGGNNNDDNNKNNSSRSSSKTRSLSHPPKPSLSPSPAFREPNRSTKDDSHIMSSPSTPRRPNFPLRGLSLQMPAHDLAVRASSPGLGNRVPLSPKLDSSITYGSPASVLPRRTRGMDFSRACTNLHHSTLAEQSSPDSSPTITGRGMMIPQRKGLGSTSGTLDSPSAMGGHWTTIGNTDRTTISSSVSSVNMLDSDSDSTDSDDDQEPMDQEAEDSILSTPQVYKLGNALGNPFGPVAISSPGGDWASNNYSPAAASLMSFQRARFRQGRSRKSSSSASGNSSLQSPGPLSPTMKSIETMNGGYFTQERRREIQSRRESLSLGTNDLHLSDAAESDDGDEKAFASSSSSNIPGTPTADGKRGVVKRAVTRRSNMLPKTKNFARIKAALMEEIAPIDSEARREAEVIRQVRESDIVPSSPALAPTVPEEALDMIPEDLATSETPTSLKRPASPSFSQQAMKNGRGLEWWNRFDERTRTPPPILPRDNSSAVGEDTTSLGVSPTTVFSTSVIHQERLQDGSQSRSRSSTPQPTIPPNPTAEFTRKLNKRRRDDDFDPYSFKRRAVSPGMSLQSSPVLPQSPSLKDGNLWGALPRAPPGHLNGDRTGSGGSSNSFGGSVKRVGLQGMNDTNDGLMNMSIE